MSDLFFVSLIIIVLAILVGAILIGIYLGSEPKPAPELVTLSQQGSGVGLLSSCLTTPCAPDLTCDGFSYLCKKSLGMACQEYAECAAGDFCSGVCVSGPTGYLDQYCPCAPGYACILADETTGLTTCKSSSSTCGTGSDCVSFICQNNGFCQPGFPLAFPCVANAQCSSGNCSNGFCQPPGIATGNRGAACAESCTLYQGATCGAETACVCGTILHEPGTCVTTSAGLASSCSTTQLCSGFYECDSNGPPIPCTVGFPCSCSFPYPDANARTAIGCIPGMSNIGSECFNNNNFGCASAASSCANSSTCSNTPSLASYTFSSGSPNFVSALQVNLIAQASPPLLSFVAYGTPGILQPYKTFPDLAGSAFYLVDYNYGLLRFDGSGWSQVFPRLSSKGLLIDAALRRFDSVIALAAFSLSGFSIVYSGSSFQTLQLFNVQSGSAPPGTQYDSSHLPITITYLDISSEPSLVNVLLVDSNAQVYTKGPADAFYQEQLIIGGPYNGQNMIGIVGPARFYYGGATGSAGSIADIAFVRFWAGANAQARLLQFSGSAAGAAVPLDPHNNFYYQVFDYSLYTSLVGLSSLSIIMLTGVYDTHTDLFQFNNVSLYNSGSNVSMPYQIGPLYRSAMTAATYNVLAPSSCS